MAHSWEKSYPKNKKWDLNIQGKVIPEILNYAVDNFPNKTAIDFLGKTYNYKELSEQVKNAKNAFIKIGVKKGTKVGIFLPNCPNFIVSYYGVLEAGGVVVNCSPLYSEPELEHLLNDSDCEILVTIDVNLLYPKAKNLLDKSISKQNKLKQLITCRLQDSLPFPKNILYPIFKSKDKSHIHTSDIEHEWNSFMKLGKNADDLQVKISVNDTAVIQYTGGTTGLPKGAELTHKNLYINAAQSKEYAINYPDGTGSMLTVLPLFHVFAMTTAMNLGILTASTLILHPRFEVDKVLKDIHKKRPTGMPGVPAMYNAINNYKSLEEYDLTSLKICVSGGAPLPAEVKRNFEKLTGCVLVEGYGLTETSPVVACNPVGELNKEGSIGLPFPDTELFVVDLENPEKVLPSGEKGELCIKGPQVMKGYYNKPKETKNVMRADGSLRTGDVAIMDDEGYFFIVDRIKEMIICGGFKVYPRHVEEVLYKYPSIMEVAVIGVPDEARGEIVKACIALKNGATADKQEIIDFCKTNLAKHEVPKEIEFFNELPKSPIGKILKKELK